MLLRRAYAGQAAPDFNQASGSRAVAAEWAAHQILQAFPWDSAPRYLLRDRDRIFGSVFVQQLEVMGIEHLLSAPASPWQRAYVERVIGTIRRECLDHVIVLNQHSLCRHLRQFLEYYHRAAATYRLRKMRQTPDPSNHQNRGVRFSTGRLSHDHLSTQPQLEGDHLGAALAPPKGT